MPCYYFVLYFRYETSNFCISFKPIIVLKVCVIRFWVLLQCEVYDKWLYLPLSPEPEFSLHFCFSSCSTCSSVFAKFLVLVGAYIYMNYFSDRWNWYFFFVVLCKVTSYLATEIGFRNTVYKLLQLLNNNIHLTYRKPQLLTLIYTICFFTKK